MQNYFFMAPIDFQVPERVPCYLHSRTGCGISVDAGGYTVCPIGGAIDGVLASNLRTRRLADLFDPVFAQYQIHYGQYHREQLFEVARRSRACAYLADDDHGPLALQEILLAGCPAVGVRTGASFVKTGETGVLVGRLPPGRQCVEADADRAVLEIYLSAIRQAQELDRYGVRQGASTAFSTERTINCLIDALNTVRSTACEDTSFTT